MNLYLSRLLLEPRSRRVANELLYPYEMHRTLMRGFPSVLESSRGTAREVCGVLFRADSDDKAGVVRVFVQSRMRPDWSVLDEIDGYLSSPCDGSSAQCKDLTRAYQQIRVGQVLSFRLRANPTKRVAKDDDPMKGKRVELTREDDQIAWLARKMESCADVPGSGFELIARNVADDTQTRSVSEVRVVCEGKRLGRKKFGASGHSLTHLSVLYEGLVRVRDPEAALETLRTGIGAGKAFGFGLLSIAPARGSGAGDVA